MIRQIKFQVCSILFKHERKREEGMKRGGEGEREKGGREGQKERRVKEGRREGRKRGREEMEGRKEERRNEGGKKLIQGPCVLLHPGWLTS